MDDELVTRQSNDTGQYLTDVGRRKALKTTLKAEINEEAWATLHSDTSLPFEKPKSGRIAVKVINHLGDEIMKMLARFPHTGQVHSAPSYICIRTRRRLG